jgi:rhodanese-related sulfurtransferase
VKDILLLIAVAGVLGATANSLSPRGISWTRPLGRGIGPQVVNAGLVPIDLRSAKELNQNRSVTFVDARTPEDFSVGRLPRAIRWGTGKRPPDPERRVVVYCDNEFCDKALALGQELKKAGYKDVAVFVDGYEAWWNAGEGIEQD